MKDACPRCRDDLTAFVDAQLDPLTHLRLRAHLLFRPGCAAAAASLRRVVDLQRDHLSEPVAIDVEALLASARDAIRALGVPRAGTAHQPPASGFRWNRSLVAGMAAAAVILVTAVGIAGRPRTVLVPLGLEEPPAALAKKPDLFRDYEMFRELEALEHFDAVNRVRLEKKKKPKTIEPRAT
jgi:anti-sigma factor RsiW